MITLRKLIYLTIAKFDSLINRGAPLVIILCYHNIGNDLWKFTIEVENFIKQIDLLLLTRRPISLTDLSAYLLGQREINEPSFILTFDDGFKGVQCITDVLSQRGITPTIFVLGSPQKANRKELGTNASLLTEDDIKLLDQFGWIIGCHSNTHADLSVLDGKNLENEIQGSKKNVEQIINKKIDFFAYPKGRYTDKVIQKTKESGYHLGLTMDDNFISKSSEVFKIPRIGVDKTHSLQEFCALWSPSVIQFRGLIKQFPIAKFL